MVFEYKIKKRYRSSATAAERGVQRSQRSYNSRTFVTRDVEKYLLLVGIVFAFIGTYFGKE
jgi:hypothetical protein